MPIVLALLATTAFAGDRRIVGGEAVTDPDLWPDAVAIMGFAPDGRETLICTGVLVAPDVVITAAHCFDHVELGVVPTRVVLRSTDFTAPGESIDVAGYEWNAGWYEAGRPDLGVIVLEQPSTVPPRLIARDCLAASIQSGEPSVIVGYGATDEQGLEFGSQLMQGFTAIVDPVCADPYDGCLPEISPGGELTAGVEGVGPCYGDSGGPLYVTTVEGIAVAGIASRLFDWLDPEAPCGAGAIWTRPDAAIAWIETIAGRTLPRPTCDGDEPPPPGDNEPPAPTAHTLVLVEGGQVVTRVEHNDPDPRDLHTYRIVVPPALGAAEIDAFGRLTYTAPAGTVGDDEVLVEVQDDGEPALTGEVRVRVYLLPVIPTQEQPAAPAPSGCASAPAPGGAAALLLVLGMLRRRRA